MPESLSSYTSSDGLNLTYADWGEGRPLLCLPGLTRNSVDFTYLAQHLDAARMICPDYRGRGGSDWADPATYTVPQEARDVLELMDHLGIEAAPILGTSRGGLIAMALSASDKGRVQGVCLNDIGPEIAGAGLERILAYVGKTPMEQSRADAVAARAALMVGFTDVPQSRWEEEVEKHFREDDGGGLSLTYDPALAEAMRSQNGPPGDLWPLFDAMEGLPLACLRGENSDLLSKATFERMQSRRPDMIAATVPGRGHVPFLDEPESVSVITSWLSGV